MVQLIRVTVAASIIMLIGLTTAVSHARPVDGGPSKSVPSVSFLSARTIAIEGETRALPYRLDAPTVEGFTPEVTVTAPEVARVLVTPRLTAGHDIGFIRIEGLRAGRTEIRIGDASIEIDVRPGTAGWSGAQTQATIIGPANGAAIWGTVTVGVEVPHDPDQLHDVVLRGRGGEIYEAATDTRTTMRPWRQLTFEVDASELAAGPYSLTPCFRDDERTTACGDKVTVQVIHLKADDPRLTAGEAEGHYDVERPERFRDARRSVGRHPDASGQQYWSNASATPAVCFPISVESPGRYQVMLRAGGTRAQGALPTVALLRDDIQEPLTNGRLLDESWHRTTIGLPITLDAGDHVLIPYFGNDFYVPMRADRNLHIDRIEVVRVADLGSDDSDGAGADTMMMSGGSAMMMGGSTMTMGGDASDMRDLVEFDDPWGESPQAPRIAFSRVHDGDIVPGVYQIEGRCWWPEPTATRGPYVTLEVNGATVMSQYSGAPRFWVDPGHFNIGENTIRMIAEFSSGTIAATPLQTVIRPEVPGLRDDPTIRHHRRFSIHDPNWSPIVRERLTNQRYPVERVATVLSSNGSIELDLPPDMEGDHRVMLHCRGDQFQGAPIAAIDLRVGEEIVKLGEVTAQNGWSDRMLERVSIPIGPKQLIISFANDHFVEGKGDRNLWIQAVTLAQLSGPQDTWAPSVEVVWPPDGETMHLQGAIVAECSDDTSLNHVELLLNGSPTGVQQSLNLRNGRAVLPLVLRSLSPGAHTVAVRVTDYSGNTTDSEPREILVPESAPEDLTTYDRAVHLLNRLGYGPDDDALASILSMGEAEWIAAEFDAQANVDAEQAALGVSFPYFVNLNPYDVQHRVMSHLLTTRHPARARFVLWAQNHFSTWIRKVGGTRKWNEHLAFTRLGPSRFEALLQNSASSPAMLGYLDQDTSYSGQINENYAREIMELHSLGVNGGYDQEDVTTLARLLTGWTASREGDGRSPGSQAADYTWRFDPQLNDGVALTLLGIELPRAVPARRFDRVTFAVEMLAAHPSTAEFVARSLLEHYVAVPAPSSMVEALAATFHETNGEFGAIMRAMVDHPEFWSDDHADRIAQPTDYFVRVARTAQHYHPWQMGQFLSRCGYAIFDRATPDGYPDSDASYADSNLTIQRWRMAEDWQWVMARLAPSRWRYDRTMPEEQWSQLMIDAIAIELTGSVLGEQSNTSCLDLLKQLEGNRDERTRALGMFIARLPEANLR